MKKYISLGLLFLVIAGGLAYGSWKSVEETDTPDPKIETAQETTEPDPQPETASYNVAINFTWSDETHPGLLPAGAHVSPAVGVVHSADEALFTPGTASTDGIEQMAETGATDILFAELDAAGISYKKGSRVDVPGTIEMQLDVSQTDHLLSIVSMLAPSPDWFVGVEDVDLFQDGVWVESLQLDLKAYDAGTDSGELFTSADVDTNPRALISDPVDSEFIESAETRFGFVQITKI